MTRNISWDINRLTNAWTLIALQFLLIIDSWISGEKILINWGNIPLPTKLIAQLIVLNIFASIGLYLAIADARQNKKLSNRLCITAAIVTIFFTLLTQWSAPFNSP
jgi:uncharacterized membrane protein YbhN (UPF0104 family)